MSSNSSNISGNHASTSTAPDLSRTTSTSTMPGITRKRASTNLSQLHLSATITTPEYSPTLARTDEAGQSSLNRSIEIKKPSTLRNRKLKAEFQTSMRDLESGETSPRSLSALSSESLGTPYSHTRSPKKDKLPKSSTDHGGVLARDLSSARIRKAPSHHTPAVSTLSTSTTPSQTPRLSRSATDHEEAQEATIKFTYDGFRSLRKTIMLLLNDTNVSLTDSSLSPVVRLQNLRRNIEIAMNHLNIKMSKCLEEDRNEGSENIRTFIQSFPASGANTRRTLITDNPIALSSKSNSNQLLNALNSQKSFRKFAYKKFCSSVISKKAQPEKMLKALLKLSDEQCDPFIKLLLKDEKKFNQFRPFITEYLSLKYKFEQLSSLKEDIKTLFCNLAQHLDNQEIRETEIDTLLQTVDLTDPNSFAPISGGSGCVYRLLNRAGETVLIFKPIDEAAGMFKTPHFHEDLISKGVFDKKLSFAGFKKIMESEQDFLPEKFKSHYANFVQGYKTDINRSYTTPEESGLREAAAALFIPFNGKTHTLTLPGSTVSSVGFLTKYIDHVGSLDEMKSLIDDTELHAPKAYQKISLTQSKRSAFLALVPELAIERIACDGLVTLNMDCNTGNILAFRSSDKETPYDIEAIDFGEIFPAKWNLQKALPAWMQSAFVKKAISESEALKNAIESLSPERVLMTLHLAGISLKDEKTIFNRLLAVKIAANVALENDSKIRDLFTYIYGHDLERDLGFPILPDPQLDEVELAKKEIDWKDFEDKVRRRFGNSSPKSPR